MSPLCNLWGCGLSGAVIAMSYCALYYHNAVLSIGNVNIVRRVNGDCHTFDLFCYNVFTLSKNIAF